MNKKCEDLISIVSTKSNLRIIYSFCLENGVMMIPKCRLSTLIFACLCFKKSLLIKNYKKVTNKIYKKKKSTLQHLDKRGGEGHIEIN